MINVKVINAINKQINAELYSAYLYLSLATHYESYNLKGFAVWLQLQSREEIEHAMKFYNFLFKRGSRPVLRMIEQPPVKFSKPSEAFALVYKHEQKVTGMINKLYELAQAEKDYAFSQFLKWFIDEQVEEEASALEIVQLLRRVGNNPGALFMLDRRLGQRGAENNN